MNPRRLTQKEVILPNLAFKENKFINHFKQLVYQFLHAGGRILQSTW